VNTVAFLFEKLLNEEDLFDRPPSCVDFFAPFLLPDVYVSILRLCKVSNGLILCC
jgi:hypothetical protein